MTDQADERSMFTTAAQARIGRLAYALALGFVAFVMAGAFAAFAGETRQALWGVVRACVADARLTGFAFPCLLADLSHGEGEGYVVLRPPVGRPDTILSPTRRVVGLEDPWLQTSDAPNLFQFAWMRRQLAPNGEQAATQPQSMGLAVNSRFARQQDQLHIHIGCVRPEVAATLKRIALVSPVRAWTKISAALPGRTAWVYRTGETDLAKIEPFRLAARQFSNEPEGLSGVTLFVAPTGSGPNPEFLVLGLPTHAPHFHLDASAEELLEASCASVAD